MQNLLFENTTEKLEQKADETAPASRKQGQRVKLELRRGPDGRGRKRTHEEIVKDFWDRVDKKSESDCWHWMGGFSADGYGVVFHNEKTIRAHRVSYEIANGIYNKTLFVCHHCDNPKCVNPKHLFLGTAGDNIRDCVKKNRHKTRNGSEAKNAKLTDENVVEIRKRFRPYDKTNGGEQLAKEFGVCRRLISQIIARERWSHVK